MFPLKYYTLSLFFGGIIALVSAVVVYYYNAKRLEAAAWLLVNVSSAIWSFGVRGIIESKQ